MKILHIAPVYNNNTQGISRSVVNLCEAQSELGHSVCLASSKPFKYQKSKKMKLFNLFDESFFSLLFGYSINKIKKEIGIPDVIIFHDIYNLKQYLILLNLIYYRYHIFLTPRGAFSKVALSRNYFLKKIYNIFIIKPILPFINGFIALNPNEKKIIENHTQKKTIIMSNGTKDNTKLYRLNKKNYELKMKRKEIEICFVGRFDIYIKGLDLLISSYLKYLKNDCKNIINITLIGDHIEKKEFSSKEYISKAITSMKDKAKIRIIGPLFGDDLISEITKMDILIQPSRTEGMPNSVLEAMSLGIPCCVTPQTNVADIIKEAGCGWEIDCSVDGILNFFREINKIDKKNISIMGQNGMDYANKYLTWHKVSRPDYFKNEL